VRIRKPDTRNRQFLEGGGIKEERAMKIEGVPDGYELVRIGRPLCGEQVLSPDGRVVVMSGGALDVDYVILRKVEKPKTFRTFRDGAEYEPHFNRPVKIKGIRGVHRVLWFDDKSFVVYSFTFAFAQKDMTKITFADDGTPFGVEVSE
jgi:hypothetical protein